MALTDQAETSSHATLDRVCEEFKLGTFSMGRQWIREVQGKPLGEPRSGHSGDCSHRHLEDDFLGDEPLRARIVTLERQAGLQNGHDRFEQVVLVDGTIVGI